MLFRCAGFPVISRSNCSSGKDILESKEVPVRLRFWISTIPPAVASAELPLAAAFTCHPAGTAGGADQISVFRGFQMFKALRPLPAAVQTPYRANVARKVAALHMNHFSVYQTVGYFLPRGKQNTLKGRAGNLHFLSASLLL